MKSDISDSYRKTLIRQQANIDKKEKERKHYVELANNSGKSIQNAEGVFIQPYEDINDEHFTGNQISFGLSNDAIIRAEEDKYEKRMKMPWVEKYRPESLSDVISHGTIMETLTKLIDCGSLPHLMFYGPPGTGKTSSALAVARQVNQSKHFNRMVLELNASDERGIDTVREKIKEFCSARQLFTTGTKLVILDEADSMTRTAQFALRRVIETYTKTTRFIIICNYANKIIPALQSRCTAFRFSPLKSHDVAAKLNLVAAQEGLSVSPDSISAVISLSRGDMRNCLNIMQSCFAAYGELTVENVYRCTGAPNPKVVSSILQTLLTRSFKDSYDYIRSIQIDTGLSLLDLIKTLTDLLLQCNVPANMLTFLLPLLAQVEEALNLGAVESIQLGGLVGSIQLARHVAFNTDDSTQMFANFLNQVSQVDNDEIQMNDN